MIGLDLMIILGLFTMACAYFSQRTGYRQGVSEGMGINSTITRKWRLH